MGNTEITGAIATKLIAKFAVTGKFSRKELVNRCIKSLNLPDSVLKNNNPNGELNRIRCKLYSALDELVKIKILNDKDDDGNEVISPVSTQIVANIDVAIKIQQSIYDFLNSERGRGRSKYEILEYVQKQPQFSGVKAQAVRCCAGDILKGLSKSKSILLKDDYYYIPLDETLSEKNERLLPNLSDGSLGVNTVLMLETWYKSKGFTDVSSEYTDGAKDGGIDGKISYTDFLGYSHSVIIQVKNVHKDSKIVKGCEIKEFCGVLSAESGATQGLFVTSANFHKDTVAFAKKYRHKYFLLIDGKKWLELAKECGYEIEN